MKCKLYITVIFLYTFLYVCAQGNLNISWKKQNKPVKNKVLSLSFSETRNELEHNYAPWDKTLYKIEGNIWVTPQSFYKKETTSVRGKTVSSILQYNQQTMAFTDFGSDTLSAISPSQYKEELYRTARYTPALLLEYFNKRKTRPEAKKDSLYNTYLETINKSQVRLFINKTTDLVDKIDISENDDFLGDISSSFLYHYTNQDQLYTPKEVIISKVNGKLQDTVYLNSFKIEKKLPSLLTIPARYTLIEETIAAPKISLQKYNEHIYFLYLEDCDSKSLVVEFKDFMLVAEAPLNSRNGDLIINEVKKHFPDKPIRFFVFSHHHPHYIGGLRSFVHEGSTIISTMGNFDYVRYLTQNQHKIKPDILQSDKKTLQINILEENQTITDDTYSMQIFNIGESSHHTRDYFIFYFPEEKMIFEGDLMRMTDDGKIANKANDRQKGLYDAITKLNIKVNTVFQSWPTRGLDYKSEISFRELEESVKN